LYVWMNSNKAPDVDTVPLEQLLQELTDAKLEKREDDIARLQKEVGKRQATGETVPAPPADDAAKKAF